MKSPAPTAPNVKYVGPDVHAETPVVAFAEGEDAVCVDGNSAGAGAVPAAAEG
jgi:hypothetical protein